MNSFGNLFRIQLSGESHGAGILLTIDGVPAGLPLASVDFRNFLQRRKSKKNATTPRHEEDSFQILTGVYNQHCTGLPLSIWVPNQNTESAEYEYFRRVPRPGHADWVAQQKFFGYNDPRGGGMFSGRMTVGLVLAGAVAKAALQNSGMQIVTQIEEIGGTGSWDGILQQAQETGDSLGGIVSCRVDGVLPALGDPFFDSVESRLAHAMFAIPGAKAIEFGDGISGSRRVGSQQNDMLVDARGKTASNHAGGIVGGLTNTNPLYFRVAFRPPASIHQIQDAFNIQTQEKVKIQINGRHDVCYVLRVPVIVEAMASCVLYDLLLQRASETAAQNLYEKS